MNTVEVLARTLWGEARNQGVEGMEAVASVILNRAKSPKWWGTDITSVCLKKNQFSCWLDIPETAKNLAALKAVTDKDPEFKVAMDVETRAVAGTLVDSVAGAQYYYERHMPAPPKWVDKLKFIKRVKDHLFYKE